MLKKIIEVFSKKESPQLTSNHLNEQIDRFEVYKKQSNNRVQELKAIADEHFANKNYTQASDYYRQTLSIDPAQYEVYKNLGVAYYYQRQYEDALKCYDQALMLKPDYPEALNNKGLVLKDLNRHEEALVYLDRAIMLKPDFAFAYRNRGLVLKQLGRINESSESYGYAAKILPDYEFFYGYWIEAKSLLCQWEFYEDHLLDITERINDGKNVIAPLVLLTISNSPELQKTTSEQIIRAKFPINDSFPPIAQYQKHHRIRVAYFSADFRNHPVSFLIAELFERHNKAKFELIAFSLSSEIDHMTARLKQSFDQFIEVSSKSDQEVVVMARELEIDIAIDLTGATAGARTNIFAMRAAPIQINYLGYPGTMGAEYLDYIIADETIIPSCYQQYYTEKVAYLPNFQVNDTKREISDRMFSREELGLPNEGFVFCSFNNITKINPFCFDIWMRILKMVEGSVLWLVDENSTAVNNLRKEAFERGVGSNRIVFAKKLELSEHLARYRIADLFLDTLPYNAGTTASDALWAGLPVLTQIGEAFAGRMAASLLNAIHLPELITKTPAEYEALAIELATNPDRLAKIKQKLANNRLTTPLFDIDYFTKNIESAYTQMYERYYAGLAPDHIYVDNPYPTKQ